MSVFWQLAALVLALLSSGFGVGLCLGFTLYRRLLELDARRPVVPVAVSEGGVSSGAGFDGVGNAALDSERVAGFGFDSLMARVAPDSGPVPGQGYSGLDIVESGSASSASSASSGVPPLLVEGGYPVIM